ncbi:HBR059Wp [Eremothecium sinecaudum]|uniref:HBR059Wp n=1 Tax=Eremothecium sinecaudum TaxID=45286 RepID=A0A120K135_9SACH|nr:HBR059Wp [Eremothecium sinecaudum]AMD18960.1 HBR059Wp [Eremothecium sinecaudum]
MELNFVTPRHDTVRIGLVKHTGIVGRTITEKQSDQTDYSQMSSSPSNTQISVFSNGYEDYDARIREIEAYYIKTLLSDDYGSEAVTSEESLSVTKPTLQNEFLGMQRSWSQVNNEIQPFSQGLASSVSNFEVEINPQYRPLNGILPLTTENLESLQRPVTKDVTPPPKKHAHQPQEKINKVLYKTELCESFSTTGFCKYNEKCQFAHGLQELKFKERSNKFRTRPCLNWMKTGYCRYGARCCFKHGNDNDIKIYLEAGLIKLNGDKAVAAEAGNAGNAGNAGKKRNLHANVNILQKMAW